MLSIGRLQEIGDPDDAKNFITEDVMTGQQAVRLIDRLLDRAQQRKLNDIESKIVLQIWEGDTYRSIADRLSYDLDYIKQIAARLWKSLSKLLGENICKSNINSVLERYQESMSLIDGNKPQFALEERLAQSLTAAGNIFHSDDMATNLQILETLMISDRLTTISFFSSKDTNAAPQFIKLDSVREKGQRQVKAKIQSLIWQNSHEPVAPNILMDEILSVLTVKNPDRKDINCLIVNCYF